MTRVPYFDDALKADYKRLFESMVIRPSHDKLLNVLVDRMVSGRHFYNEVEALTRCSWWIVAVIHSVECGLSFEKHLHNGDPLSAKTVHVPKGRPLGEPPWTWVQSACDALRLKYMIGAGKWDFEYQLYRLEGYNGYGYRVYHPEVNTPYLWSGSNHYTAGKYVRDGKFDPHSVSAQLGIALPIKRMWERRIITLNDFP